ncbi:ubiD family decarboxylase [Colletotrichum higginsianum]|nr:ubiD family decarboxylase [Colletotrichum higginsianum]
MVFTHSVDPVWFLWSVREASTAMLVGNLVLGLPILRTCWRFFLGAKSSKASSGATGDSSASAALEPTSSRSAPTARVAINSVYTDIELHGKDGTQGMTRRLSVGQESV